MHCVPPLLAEKQTFLRMLQFIYIGTIPSSSLTGRERADELLKLLSVADKYGVASLIHAVCTLWMDLLDDVELLHYTGFLLPKSYLEQYSEITALQNEARETLSWRFAKVYSWADSDFGGVGLESVVFLLGRDELEADSEEEVFEATLCWVRKTFKSEEERRKAMEKICPHLRFAQMSGDFIEDHLTGTQEMESPVVQRHIREGLSYAASSQSRKDAMQERRFQKRRGRKFEITFTAKLNQNAADWSRQYSPPVQSHFWKWQILVRKEKGERNTVALYLSAAATRKETIALHPVHVEYSFYARSAANGEWLPLQKLKDRLFVESNCEWGYADAFKESWEEMRRNRKWVGASDAIEVKVEGSILDAL